MKKTIVAALAALTAAGALGAAGAASAAADHDRRDRYYDDRYDDDRYDDRYDDRRGYRDDRAIWEFNRRQERVLEQLRWGMNSGRLSSREAAVLRDQYYYIERLERRYASGGFNGRELSELNGRLNDLAQRLRYEANDRDYNHRGYRGW